MEKLKKVIYLFVAIIICGGSIAYPSPASAFSGGTGTAGDPYLISDCDELQSISELDASYELTQDIDCSATSGWNGGSGFVPIGTFSESFSGTFDGQRHTITGLTIDRPDETDVAIGLFGAVDGGTIKNVGLFSASITGNGVTGALVGIIGAGLIENVGVSATITSNSGEVPSGLPYAGVGVVVGMAGNGVVISRAGALGAITVLQANSSIVGAGGIVGLMAEPVTLRNTFSWVDVTSEAAGQVALGGLVGFSLYLGGGGGGAVIENSYATPTLGLSDGNLGGLLAGGLDNGTVSNSFANGTFLPPASDSDTLYIGSLIGSVNTLLVSTNNYVTVQGLNPTECFTAQGTIDNCTVIDDSLTPEYYYNQANEPLAQWDFTTLWAALDNNYPVLSNDILAEPTPDPDPSEEPTEETPTTTGGTPTVPTFTPSASPLTYEPSTPTDTETDEVPSDNTPSPSPVTGNDDTSSPQPGISTWVIIVTGAAIVLAVGGVWLIILRLR